MPIISPSTYRNKPFFLYNGHVQTLYPGIFRKIKNFNYHNRERFILSDGDFCDLDWVKNGYKNLVILSHGLEGNSERHYMRAPAKYLSEQGWDILAWNCRSCSGEMNVKMRLYNHGEIGDIGEVIQHAVNLGYENIVLYGISLGGAIILNYLGHHGKNVPKEVKKAVAISVPCDMKASVAKLNQKKSAFYRKRFFKMLSPKMRIKAEEFPGVIDINKLDKIEKWEDFDDYFTAPINGYESGADFYKKASARFVMDNIQRPTLLINAQNDPILEPICTPLDIAEQSEFLFIDYPEEGGHVGFMQKGELYNWAEERAFGFIGS